MESAEKQPYPLIASVLFDLKVEKPLDYGIPEPFVGKVVPGVQVSVSLRGKRNKGLVLEVKEQSHFPHLLPILEVLSDGPLLPSDLFELAQFSSKYYLTPLSQVLKVMLPRHVRKEQKESRPYLVRRLKPIPMLREEARSLREKFSSQAKVLDVLLNSKKEILLSELLEKAQVTKSPVETLRKKGFIAVEKADLYFGIDEEEEYFKTLPKVLKLEQKETLEKITSSLCQNRFNVHLIHGITGSGKTEVYLQAIEFALQQQKGTIVLVPEIMLTTQTIERFKSRFDDKIAVLHYRLSDRERKLAWEEIRKGKARIAIGARSALFSPMPSLGLIIVDEEHDGAYKQSEQMPCYQARDLAVVRAKYANATIILGSATPSLESFYNAEKKKYLLSVLTKRAEDFPLPKVTIVDMRQEYEKQRGFTHFSRVLLDAIGKRVKTGEQTILFLNRRGYHTSLFCLSCGHIFKCPRCDVALTFHLQENLLSCHLCDHREIPPRSLCPKCKKGETLKYKGAGTEQVERALHAIFPSIRTLRIDTDTTRHKGSFDLLFREFRTGKADLLIGTQMVAKGLHFPLVTLVGILNCDGALHIPDFRASESVFQLITQVAGRSGRNMEGEVILQTQMPENPIIKLAAKQDFHGFFESECQSRKFFSFPPHSHLIKFLVSGRDPKQVELFGSALRELIKGALHGRALVHPLTPSGHPKINDRFRFQFLLRTHSILAANEKIQKVLSTFTKPREVHLLIDVDPLFTFF